MILKPFKVNSPDGKTFYEGDAPAKLSDDLAHAKAVMEGRAPVFVRIDAEAAPSAVVLDDERAAFEAAFVASHEYPEKADQLEFRKGWEARAIFAGAASPQAKVTQVIAIAEKFIDRAYLRDFRRKLEEVAADAQATATQPAQPTPHLPCLICNGVEGCDHTVPERARAAQTERALTDAAGKRLPSLDEIQSLRDHGHGEEAAYWEDARKRALAAAQPASDQKGDQ